MSIVVTPLTPHIGAEIAGVSGPELVDRRVADECLMALERRPDEPLRIVWEFSTDETSAALLTEFLALANHRKTIRAAIHEVIEHTRTAQLQVLEERWDEYPAAGDLSPEALLFLLHGIPKMVMLEEAVGMSSGHREVLELVEQRLDALEPRRRPQPRKAS